MQSCSKCGADFDLRSDKPGYANVCPNCTLDASGLANKVAGDSKLRRAKMRAARANSRRMSKEGQLRRLLESAGMAREEIDSALNWPSGISPVNVDHIPAIELVRNSLGEINRVLSISAAGYRDESGHQAYIFRIAGLGKALKVEVPKDLLHALSIRDCGAPFPQNTYAQELISILDQILSRAVNDAR